MATILIGYFRYTKKDNGVPMVCLFIRTSQIDPSKGDGYNVKQFYVNADRIPSDLHAGKVEVKLDAWNNNILQEIKNI